MPINMMISVHSSVGAGGKNQKDDVRAVQRQLNSQMNPPRKYLSEDGVSGKKTIGTIRDFQRCVCGFRRADGRVDPGGKTLKRLNDPGAEGAWAGMSMMPMDYLPTPAPVGGGSGDDVPDVDFPAGVSDGIKAKFRTVWIAVHVKKVLRGKREAEETVEQFLDYFVNNQVKNAKTIHAIVDLLNTAVTNAKLFEFAKGLKILHKMHFGNPEAICKAIGDLARNQGSLRTMRCIAAAGANPRFGAVLKGIGRIAVVLAILFALLEAKNHWNKGHYGPAVKELYKGFMGLAILPVAIVDAIQTAWGGIDPGTAEGKEENVLYEIIRHGNLLDHGGNAIDAAATIGEVCIKGVKSGKIDLQMMDALVERMRNSSGKNFVLLGEFLGDWYYDRLVEAGKAGEELGEWIGRKYGAQLLPLVKFFDL